MNDESQKNAEAAALASNRANAKFEEGVLEGTRRALVVMAGFCRATQSVAKIREFIAEELERCR